MTPLFPAKVEQQGRAARSNKWRLLLEMSSLSIGLPVMEGLGGKQRVQEQLEFLVDFYCRWVLERSHQRGVVTLSGYL